VPVYDNVAQVPYVHAIPDGMMTGFNAEARGTSIPNANAVDVLQSATGSSGQPPAPMATRASTGGREKPEASLIKPQRFDGRGSLDTFLRQFEQLSDYMSWGERERHYHLGASLMGPASQVLEELPATGSTSTQVITLLQSKFGTKLQAESFQARLKSRRRKEGQSIQDLYRDISRLLLLAYPGENPASIEHTAVDAFISALNDQLMEFKVMKLRPKTLREATVCATRLETYADTVRNRPAVVVEQGNGKSKVPACSCSVLKLTADIGNSSSKEATLMEHIGQLEKQLEQVNKGNRGAQGSSTRKAGSCKEGSSRGQSEPKKSDGARPNRETHPCTLCKELGQWRRECPKRKAEGEAKGEGTEAKANTVLSVNASMSPTKIYVTAEVNGEPIRCLLDSGCE